ncbi:nickel ABC transporter permease [bacterium]|nr:nickel ABC transporter permease [bacterium]
MRILFKSFVIVIFFALSMNVLSWANNPFLAESKKETAFKKPPTILRVFQPVLNFSHQFQKQLKLKLTAFARDMRGKPWGKSFWLFLLFSFLYGIFHAIGPGHGKSIAMSYFLSRPGKVIHGFLMGNLLTFMHVFSAVAVVMTLYFIFKVTGIARFDQLNNTFKILSYGLLIIVGCYLAGRALYEVKKWRQLEAPVVSNTPDLKSLILTSLVAGLIPCPGAAIILSFSIIMKIMFQGLIAMVFIAVGMGVTTSGIALLSIISRKTILSVFDKQSKMFIWAYASLAVSGAAIIVIISLLLLLETL